MFENLYRHDGWGIGLIHAPVSALLASHCPAVDWLRLDVGAGFAADPFLIENGGKQYCFFEELPYATNRGHISYAVIGEDDAGRLPVRRAIVADHHLSYPFLIRYRDEIFCIPEGAQSGRTVAYVADDFPNGWRERHTLIDDFPAVDPTIFEHDGRWWLLATDGRAGWNTALHVFYADDMLGQWTAHPGNPVKVGATGTRPAGRPFSVDGVLYRPAQDCGPRYGARLIVNEILELTPERFAERAVSTIAPRTHGPYADGMHTANASGGVIVVDGNHLHFEPLQALRAIRDKARHIAAAAGVRSG